MLSRTPDFQKFSSPSELGVPVAVGDAWRLPSQCLPESSNTKLSNSQQHPKAFPFSFTSTQRLPKMSCSIYSPFASMCQDFTGEREKGSLVRRGVFIGYLLSHLSLFSTPGDIQMNFRQSSTRHSVLLTRIAMLVSSYPGLPAQCSSALPGEHLGVPTWSEGTAACRGSSGTSLKICEHPRLPITFQLQDLVFTLSVISHDVYASESVSSTKTWIC